MSGLWALCCLPSVKKQNTEYMYIQNNQGSVVDPDLELRAEGMGS